MKASASILIKCPVSETFEAFADIPNRKDYLPEITKLEVDSLMAEGKGVKWTEERQIGGNAVKGTLEITGYIKSKSLVFTTHSGGLIFKTRFNFQFAGEKATKVVVTIGGKPKGILARFMDAFLSKNSDFIGQQLKKELESYKKEIEKD